MRANTGKEISIIEAESADDVGIIAAKIVLDKIESSGRRGVVFALPTGRTALNFYKELVALSRTVDPGIWKNVKTFGLDEYLGLGREHPQSFRCFLDKNILSLIPVSDTNKDFLDGLAHDPGAECERYERKIGDLGGLGITVLGIGSNGHIAFNEPGAGAETRTRTVKLSSETRKNNAEFFGSIEGVPEYALTIGIGTILESTEVVLISSGKAKAEALRRAIENPPSPECPASFLQLGSSRVTFVLDRESRSMLSR